MLYKNDTMKMAVFIALATFLVGAVAATITAQQAEAFNLPSCPLNSPTPDQPRGGPGPGCTNVVPPDPALNRPNR
jgi:hypothetical protein